MRRFKSILFVADGSEGERSVLARAVGLAAANNAALTLFDALDAESYAYEDPNTSSAVTAINKVHLEERTKELESLRTEVVSEHPDLNVKVGVALGSPAISAIQAVLSNRHDLVIKAAGGGGMLKRLFGSTDQKLMRKCPCPVWIVKPSPEHYFKRILAAVDLNPTHPETESLARKVMELSSSLAKEEGSELHVLHVWRLAGEVKLRGRAMDTTEVDQIVRDMEAAHQTELDDMLREFPEDERRTVHLIKGQAGDVIPEFAEKLNVDLVVIGTVGRSGVPGLLIGNTAEKVLSAVDCSVLTLKPEGFVSPVQV